MAKLLRYYSMKFSGAAFSSGEVSPKSQIKNKNFPPKSDFWGFSVARSRQKKKKAKIAFPLHSQTYWRMIKGSYFISGL